jgi:hypothetical protein
MGFELHAGDLFDGTILRITSGRFQTCPYSFGCQVASVAAVDQSLPQM